MDGKCYENNPLCWLHFHLWCVMVDPRYICCHITSQTPFLFRWNFNKHFFPIINMRSSFLSIVSNCLADHFSYPNPCEEYWGYVLRRLCQNYKIHSPWFGGHLSQHHGFCSQHHLLTLKLGDLDDVHQRQRLRLNSLSQWTWWL